MAFNKNIAQIDEYSAVQSTIENGYIRGLVEGNFDVIATSFHPTATMHGFFDGDFLAGSFENLKGYVETYGAAKDMRSRIDIFALTTTMASVRIELENCGCGSDYTDYHTLMKIDGKWYVMAKLFHQYDRT